jgi:16S rRNA (adenine1518-N6/adenine1519-N6)-dimethyltransferase
MKTAKLGQNFLVNRNVTEKIANRFFPVDGPILEIGPGKGILTELLLKYRKNNRLIAVEYDELLFYRMRETFSAESDFQVLNRDILKVDLHRLFPEENGQVNVVSNVPYYISKDLMEWVIAQAQIIQKGVFMMQKEFVEKLTSRCGTKEYNAQSILFNGLYNVEKLFDVQPGSFSPPPKVKSTVFSFKRERIAPGENIVTADFYVFLQQCFRNRRKTLLNNLSASHSQERLWEMLESCGLNPQIRAEQLSLEDFLNIYGALSR